MRKDEEKRDEAYGKSKEQRCWGSTDRLVRLSLFSMIVMLAVTVSGECKVWSCCSRSTEHMQSTWNIFSHTLRKVSVKWKARRRNALLYTEVKWIIASNKENTGSQSHICEKRENRTNVMGVVRIRSEMNGFYDKEIGEHVRSRASVWWKMSEHLF